MKTTPWLRLRNWPFFARLRFAWAFVFSAQYVRVEWNDESRRAAFGWCEGEPIE